MTTGGSLISERAQALLGQVLSRGRREIEKGAIRVYADALMSPNPLWSDEAYAKQTRYGGIICPPTFLGGPGTVYTEFNIDVPDLPANRLNAGQDWELLKPVRPGDVLTFETVLKELYQRDGRAGSMVIAVRETTWKNQNGEVVAITRNTGISRP